MQMNEWMFVCAHQHTFPFLPLIAHRRCLTCSSVSQCRPSWTPLVGRPHLVVWLLLRCPPATLPMTPSLATLYHTPRSQAAAYVVFVEYLLPHPALGYYLHQSTGCGDPVYSIWKETRQRLTRGRRSTTTDRICQ